MGSVAKEIDKETDYVAESLRNGSESISGLCQSFTGVANCTADQIVGAIIRGNEKRMADLNKELCNEVKAGASEADVVEKAGLVEGTKLNCSVPSGPKM